jgi:hypothetical protein
MKPSTSGNKKMQCILENSSCSALGFISPRPLVLVASGRPAHWTSNLEPRASLGTSMLRHPEQNSPRRSPPWELTGVMLGCCPASIRQTELRFARRKPSRTPFTRTREAPRPSPTAKLCHSTSLSPPPTPVP